MDSTFIHFRRKSIFWQMQPKPMIHPLKALGLPSVGERRVANDLNTTQVAYNRWRELRNYQHMHTNQAGKQKAVDASI